MHTAEEVRDEAEALDAGRIRERDAREERIARRVAEELRRMGQ